MQIIAGKHRGRRLSPLNDDSIRPTSARAREALFNILTHRFKEDGSPLLSGARFADLCCGCGAIGLEALSRGALNVTFVDDSATAIAMTKRNAEMLKETAKCHFFKYDVCALAPATIPYDILYLDPPYDTAILPQATKQLVSKGWLKQGSIVITEQGKQGKALEQSGFELEDTRRYGENVLHIYVYSLD